MGILSPLARILTSRSDTDVTVAAGNMHLLDRYGHTVDEIGSDCYDHLALLDAPSTDATSVGMTDIMAATAKSTARVISERRPDVVVVLGDRYEILGAASAAVFACVPIVHLHGGEVTLGAIDDTVRRALSAMADLHLVATKGAADRLKSMCIDPESIGLTGAIGVENVLDIEPMDLDDLKASLDNFNIDPSRTLLVTYHPVTRDPNGGDAASQLDALLSAIENTKDVNAIITYPNNDSGGDAIAVQLTEFAAVHPDRIKLVQSLGLKRYISAMHHCLAVVGNTSSGILEAPSTRAWTIDIGPRQNGRERARSVIHVEAETEAIIGAIRRVLTSPSRCPSPGDNPYYQPNAAETAANAIIRFISNTKK